MMTEKIRRSSEINDLDALSASETARLIGSGKLSAREVIEAHIERIETVNPHLNAVVVPLFEQARMEAAAIDANRQNDDVTKPLLGVPVTIKESFDVAGTPTTVGLSKLANHKSAADSYMVSRLRRAGAIILGKTNVSQLLLGNESDNPLYGRTNNPWNFDRSPGGSSGGEAAIIAAGGSALGLGSDIGGSVRLPAHACGIHAFKPTSGRLTMQGHARIFPGQEGVIAQPGPLARSVADLETAMSVLAAPGQEKIDSSIPPVHWPSSGNVSLRTMRIAMHTDNGFIKASPSLRRAVLDAARALEERGAIVEEWSPPDVPEAMAVYFGLLFADGMASARRALRGSKRSGRIRPALLINAFPRSIVAGVWPRLLPLAGQRRMGESMRSMGRVSADGYWKLVEERTRYRTRFINAFDAKGFDAIICPPDALPAPLHGSGMYLADALSYAALYNLLGMPAGVVAATRVRSGEESDRAASMDIVERAAIKVEAESAGLPVGVQVVARHWREDVALAVMAALETYFKAQPDYPCVLHV